jgi:hypothetical protein
MAHIIELPPISEWIKTFWLIIKSLWWLWLLVLALGLVPVGLDYFFKWLKRKISKK